MCQSNLELHDLVSCERKWVCLYLKENRALQGLMLLRVLENTCCSRFWVNLRSTSVDTPLLCRDEWPIRMWYLPSMNVFASFSMFTKNLETRGYDTPSRKRTVDQINQIGDINWKGKISSSKIDKNHTEDTPKLWIILTHLRCNYV